MSLWLTLSATALWGAPPRMGGARLFDTRVKAILIERCIACHSGEHPQGKLQLAVPSAARDPRVTGSPGVPSRLLARVKSGAMPPGKRLPAAETAALADWIRSGARWSGGALDPLAATTSTRAGRDWWALQPVRAVKAPSSASGSASPSEVIDAFLEETLRKRGLRPNPPAERSALIRRLSYDLHGLPPAPEEIRAFVEDPSPDAVEKAVDRLLASPRYGERMARRWLDVARFAESDGYEHDLPRLTAFEYRDWVIRAFNEDLPYERFVQEQIAGDALHPGDPRAGIPTGFLVAGGHDTVAEKSVSPMTQADARQDELEDTIGVTSQAFLGLTAQCARCHDHKFDPIPQRDYYRLQAALIGARHPLPGAKVPFYGARSTPPPVVRRLERGSVLNPKEEVTPGGLSALTSLKPDLIASSEPERRLALAKWITAPENPLPARVWVNRVWGWFFGTGLVATPNDFGFQGDRPSHPELLDWLASAFRRQGHSTRSLVRALVLTRAYRRSSDRVAASAQIDAGNRMLWRHASRRLEAEEVRDAMLAVSGRLNPAAGGPGYQLFTWKDNAGALYALRDADGAEFRRRAIYRLVVRGLEDPLLAGLDCPDPSSSTPRRASSVTPTQALSLMNHTFVERESAALAERIRSEGFAETPAAVERSYLLALGRKPTRDERHRAAEFADRRGLDAWCRVLFNTAEFLTAP